MIVDITQKREKIVNVLIKYGVKDKETAMKCFIELINVLSSR
jgi:hypothetical protein